MAILVAAVTPSIGAVRGDGGSGATEPSDKRRSLTVVPDAQREANIKKLPPISHKAAANRTDALKVLGVRNIGGRTDGGRRRYPSARSVRQSLRHGRCVLCPYARG